MAICLEPVAGADNKKSLVCHPEAVTLSRHAGTLSGKKVEKSVAGLVVTA
jgi:hypothetical protein